MFQERLKYRALITENKLPIIHIIYEMCRFDEGKQSESMGLIVDNFAGGGSSTGIEMALNRPIDIAINHDPAAILMYKINHPFTKHYQESVWDVDIRKIRGKTIADPYNNKKFYNSACNSN